MKICLPIQISSGYALCLVTEAYTKRQEKKRKANHTQIQYNSRSILWTDIIPFEGPHQDAQT